MAWKIFKRLSSSGSSGRKKNSTKAIVEEENKTHREQPAKVEKLQGEGAREEYGDHPRWEQVAEQYHKSPAHSTSSSEDDDARSFRLAREKSHQGWLQGYQTSSSAFIEDYGL